MTEQSTERTAQQIHEDPIYQRLEKAKLQVAEGLDLQPSVEATETEFTAIGIPNDVIEHFVQDRMALSWRMFTDAIGEGGKIHEVMPGITGGAFADGILTGYAFAKSEPVDG